MTRSGARRWYPASFSTRLMLVMTIAPVLVAAGMALVLSRTARQEFDAMVATGVSQAGDLVTSAQPLCDGGLAAPTSVAADAEVSAFVPCAASFMPSAVGSASVQAVEVPLEFNVAANEAASLVLGEDGRFYALTGVVPFSPLYEGDRQNFLNSVNRVIFATAAGSALLAGTFAFAMGRQVGRPLRVLQAAAREVGAGNLASRVEAGGAAEVTDLADAFNQMTADLTRAEDLRRTMTANVAHELRTPLANLAGYLDAIGEDVLTADAATVAVLRDETASLVRLVDDLEQIALGDAGRVSLRRTPVDLHALIEQVVASFALDAAAHEVALDALVSPGLPLIDADPQRLAQVLRNLLANALRHTQAGGSVLVRAEGNTAGVTLEVVDDGEGIAPTDLDRIFEPFYRADPSRVRATGGTGLGLAVVRRLVEAHGGRVSARSQLGVGSTLTVHLPLGGNPS